jgi:NTE family protein
VRPTGRASAELLAAAAGATLGQSVDAATARAAADQLYASGDFERVEVQSALAPDGRALILVPVEAPWRRNPLRLGLELQTEQGTREDATRLGLTATTTLRPLNAWGGELRALLRLGSQTTLMGEWWQPLGPGSRVFGVTSWRRDAETQGIYIDGQRVTQLGVSTAAWRLGAGVSLGRSGDVQVGLERSRSRVSPLLRADLESGPIAFTTTQAYAQLRVDTLDAVAFPTRGTLLGVTWRSGSISEADEGSEADARVLTGFTWGRWAGHVYAEASHASKGVAPLALGGFLRLSGTPFGSLYGQTSLLGRVVMGVPLAHMPLGLGGAVRAGVSAELGGLFQPGQSRQLGDLKQAGSAFVSVDTRFGPVYFALGATHRGGRSTYIFLGPFW